MTSLKNYEPLPFLYDYLDLYDYDVIEKYIVMMNNKDSSEKVSISGTDFSKDAFEIGMLLAIIAIKLYYYNTESFYKMLEFMQSYNKNPDVQRLATEILTKVKEFDPLKSSGMNINVICINTYVGISCNSMILIMILIKTHGSESRSQAK